MKKFAVGFGTGISCVALVIFGYISYLVAVANPGFKVSSNPRQLTLEQKKDVIIALTKLSEISNIVGLDRYTALFSGSVAALGSEVGMDASEIRSAFFRVMTTTMKYGNQNGDYNPYLEAKFALAFWLKDSGENEEAKKTVVQAIIFAQKNAPDSYWIQNFKGLQKRL